MWCQVWFQTFFYVLWIFYSEKTSAEKQLMSGKVQDRHKRDVDILVECDKDCVADEEVGEYDVLLEYDLEETYQARRPYSSSYTDYGYFGKPRKCSYPCKVLKLTNTGDFGENVENQIVSIEEVDNDSIEGIIGEGVDTDSSNFLPSLDKFISSTVSEGNIKIDGLSSETPISLIEDLEVKIVGPNITSNASNVTVFNLSHASNVNSSDSFLNLTETSDLNTFEQAINLTETTKTVTSDQVVTTSTTTKPIIMVPKVIRLTVLEAEMVDTASLKRPPTVKTTSANFVHGFVHPINSSVNISLNYENVTERSQMKYDDVTPYEVINTSYSSIYNFNASTTHIAIDSSHNISLKSENLTHRPLLKYEVATTSQFIETTQDLLHEYSNSVTRVLSMDADNGTTSTENIAQTMNFIDKGNSEVSRNFVSSFAMKELNPSLQPSLENNPITTTEKIETSLETESIYTEEMTANDRDIIASNASTDIETTTVLKEVEAKSDIFSSNTTIPTTNVSPKASTNYNYSDNNVSSTVGGLVIKTATSLIMDDNFKDDTNISISLDQLSTTTAGSTLSADYIELVKSLIVEDSENGTELGSIESVYSNSTTENTITEGNSFENTKNDSNHNYSFSGNFTANDSSFPKEFQKSLVEKLKRLDAGANVAIMAQHHSSNKTTGITTLRKVGTSQTKEEKSR